jgi:asparagine synthase (glutamine-hydrolysing)
VHLFVIGCGLEPALMSRLRAELVRTARAFPHLDAATAWSAMPHAGMLAAGITSPATMVAPREYVAATDEAIVLFDGLPLAVHGTMAAHRASELAANWQRITADLEGRFACVRIDRHEPVIELVTDPLGVAQVYVWESGGRSVASNSAGLVQRVAGTTEPDPLGVSLFLAMDWVGADRTLRRGVRVVPAGQHWAWRTGDRAWRRRTYWSVASDAPPPLAPVHEDMLDTTIDGIADIARTAASVSGSVNAPLTGGKDSRMLAAVLIRSGTRARYWTKGDQRSRDVEIATQIAARHGLPHRLANRPTQQATGRDPTRDVSTEWPRITREFVLQTDGLASVFLVGNIQGQPDRLDAMQVTLSAMCAESARAVESHEFLCGRGASVGRTARYLPYADSQTPRGLVDADAYAISRRAVRDWVERTASAGVFPANLAVAFYLDERCRRWASNNPRELAQTEDKVLPFMTRPYVTNVLGLHPDERANHRLHRGIIRRLVPELEHTPPLDIPWRTSPGEPSVARVVYNTVMASLPYAARRAVTRARDLVRTPHVSRAPWSPYDEASWLEANLDHAREAMLSRPRSPLWAFLHRPMVERLLAPGTSPDVRRLHQLPLFAAYTMFLFEAIEEELAAEPLAAVPPSTEPLPTSGPAAGAASRPGGDGGVRR